MSRRRGWPRWLPVLALVVAGSSCAGCDQDENANGSPPVTARQVTQGAPSARQVRVGLTEWTISTSSSSAPAGRVTLVVTNAGGTEHDLVVRGRAGSWETPDLDPGQQSRLTVRARPGEVLKMWCSMPGHRAQGMHTTLRIAG
jgi:uncharacterized cupredoxin-like copper-binding protein